MEDVTQSTSGATAPESSGSEQSKDVVAYETYKKTIAEVKKLKSELDGFRAKDAEREAAALQEQGKYKEALDLAVKKQKELEAKLSDKDKSYARSVFIREAKSVALQMGALPEAVEDIVKVGQWSDVEVDEGFNPNLEQLKTKMQSIQKDKPFYFQKSVTSPKTVTSSSGVQPVKNNLKELSVEEIKAKLRSLK